MTDFQESLTKKTHRTRFYAAAGRGEVQKLALEELLRASFAFDRIEEVGKGKKGRT